MGYKKVDMEMVQNRSAWSTWYDVQNGLVLHIAVIMKSLAVDKDAVDPDGVPLMFFDPQLVTRVRKMTDQELDECLKSMIKLEYKEYEGEKENNEPDTKKS